MSAVVITGAAGFLGRHLVAHYRAAGREIVEITPESSPPIPHGATVIHCAAVRNAPRANAAAFTEVNVTLTETLAREAMRSSARRFIHLGTALVLGSSATPLDESAPLVTNGGPYVASKRDGILALERLVDDGLPLVTLLPSIIYGPDHPDARNRVTSHMRRILGKPLRIGVAAPPRNLVFVDDVVRAIVHAEERGALGARYVIAGEDATPDAFEREVFKAARKSPTPRVVVPSAAATAAARAMDALLGYDVSSGWVMRVRTLLAPWCFRAVRAIRELEYDPTPLARGVRKTVETFG